MPAPSITEATVKIRKTSSRIFWIGSGGTPEGNDPDSPVGLSKVTLTN